MSGKPLVAIIMGSRTDAKVMREAARCLRQFEVPFDFKIVSAHRTPEQMVAFAKTAKDKGFRVVIAGAGGAAHLPGMVASLTNLPVIGVPITATKLKGLDALLSIAQMPKGVPVATVAIENAWNAGLLAVRILALESRKLSNQLSKFQASQKAKVLRMNRTLRKGKN